MDRAIGALGESLADGLRRALGTGAERDHFSAVLLLELQACFERVGVRLIDFEAEIVFLNPGAGAVDAERRIPGRSLLDRNNNFHGLLRILLENQRPIGPAEAE